MSGLPGCWNLVDRLDSGSSVHYARKGSSPFPGILKSSPSPYRDGFGSDREGQALALRFVGVLRFGEGHVRRAMVCGRSSVR